VELIYALYRVNELTTDMAVEIAFNKATMSFTLLG
jgi:hypothetical protein